MIVALKGIFLEFDIGISKCSNFESRQFQSISAKFSDRGTLGSPQSEPSDYENLIIITKCYPRPIMAISSYKVG